MSDPLANLPSTPTAPSAARTGPHPDSPAFRWVPIRSLSERHRPRVLAHLLALEPHDRYLRFGYAANDTQIGRYVDLLDFGRDEVFGVFNRRLQLVAMAHLAYLPEEHHIAEFGVSVAAHARGRGYGSRLFDHAVLHARNRSIDTMIIHALSENTAMIRIARNAGARIERDGGESEARVKLPPENMGTRLEEMVEGRAAEFDYQWKNSVRQFDRFLGLLGNFARSGRGIVE